MERDACDAERKAPAEQQRRQCQLEQVAQQTADKWQDQVATQLADFESQLAALVADRSRLKADAQALAEQRRQWEQQRMELAAQEQNHCSDRSFSASGLQELPAAGDSPDFRVNDDRTVAERCGNARLGRNTRTAIRGADGTIAG